MTSQASPSSAVTRLDTRIQRWIWEQRWVGLREAQERALVPILEGRDDVIIAAATASGKTEAAFLPILTRLAAQTEGHSTAFYISPLKALINDQWGRLEPLCETLDIPVVPWHGDASKAKRQRFLRRPDGVVLITPESLEAMFVRRGSEVARIFRGVSHLVVDELHAFIGSDRGKQIQSLLCRIEEAAERRIPRIGLSATLGEMSLAAEYLRPGRGAQVNLIVEAKASFPIQLQVRGYCSSPRWDLSKPAPSAPGDSGGALTSDVAAADDSERPVDQIAKHLFKTLRSGKNLVFPNSRTQVEVLTDRLSALSEQHAVAMVFYPHHGSLSKAVREETEAALKDPSKPATGIATSTLELGIDIGAIKAVAQVGPAPSVAALRQRLGRSGRRPGESAILRAYIMESEIDAGSGLDSRLRLATAQMIAQIQLLMRGWFEPPSSHALHLSTLIQQVLSVLVERGGCTAIGIYDSLVQRGAFSGLSVADFKAILRTMGQKELLIQDHGGLLLPGPLGERLANERDFYAAFEAGEEWIIETGGRRLGTIPFFVPLKVGQTLIFSGRRWTLVSLDAKRKVAGLMPSRGGTPPRFGGDIPSAHQAVRVEMRRLLSGTAPIPYLCPVAAQHLLEARAAYQQLELDRRHVVIDGNRTSVIPWVGDDTLETLRLVLQAYGLKASRFGALLDIWGHSVAEIGQALRQIAAAPPTLPRLLKDLTVPHLGKWDWGIPEDLRAQNYADLRLDIQGAIALAHQLTSDPGFREGE